MKTPDEIKMGLAACKRDGSCDRGNCPYRHLQVGAGCVLAVCADSLEYIRQLEKQLPRWISVEERLPKPETQVLILAKRGKYTVITNGMYEDGTLNTEDSDWHWYDIDFEYDEENDAYIIPAGWWEYKHYNGDDEYNHAIDDKVTHWMPLPEPPKENEGGNDGKERTAAEGMAEEGPGSDRG